MSALTFVTGAERKEMRELAARGLSIRVIARQVGRSGSTVRRHCADLISARAAAERAVRQEQRAKIRRLTARNWRLDRIAEECGVCVPTVRKYAGSLIGNMGRKADPMRWRRMVQAVGGADRGCRDEIATRFGFSSVGSLNQAYRTARMRLKALGYAAH